MVFHAGWWYFESKNTIRLKQFDYQGQQYMLQKPLEIEIEQADGLWIWPPG
jgi:hypothetical protein